MSVTKNKTTRYHDTPKDVVYKATWIRMDNLDDLKSLVVRGRLSGTVGSAEGEVDYVEGSLSLADVKAEFTAAEKGAAKTFIAAVERTMARKDEELSTETYTDTDVFVDNAEA